MDRRASLAATLKATLLLAAPTLPGPSTAQGRFPDKPLRVIVPFTAGGGGDLLARLYAPRLAERLGTTSIVENRPGAGGNLGTEAGLKAAPDGTTLVAISSTYPCQAVISKLGYDPVADLTPIVLVTREPAVLTMNNDVPARTLREFFDLARRQPGKLAYGSAGIGSQAHFASEQLAMMADIRLNHVAYKGTSQAFNDLLGGVIQVTWTTPAFVTPHIRSGKARALAVTGARRLPQLPDVPTMDEAGLPGYEYMAWNGVIGPKGIPPDIAARLNAEFNEVLKSGSEMSNRLAADGMHTIGGTPATLLDLIRSDIERWKVVAQKAGIKAG